MSSLAAQFNACDVDYGDRIDAWRRQIADETVRNVIWYLALIEALALVVLYTYLIYLLREKKLRHIVVVDIVCQLYNSWAYSDNKARTVITQHNRWMREVNDAYERQLRSGTVQESLSELTSLEADAKNSHAQLEPAFIVDNPLSSASGSTAGNAEPRKSAIPSIAALETYGFETNPSDPNREIRQDVNAALAQVNQSAAAAVSESDVLKELERTKARLKAIEEQNGALKRILNENREKAITGEMNPFQGGGL